MGSLAASPAVGAVTGVCDGVCVYAAFAFVAADFDVNRAAEYHFTHPEDLQEAEAGPVVTTPTSRLQQVEVRSTAPPGHAMTVLVVGRGNFSVVVPEHVQVGEMFQIALPALSLESLNEEILSLQVRRPAKGGFGKNLGSGLAENKRMHLDLTQKKVELQVHHSTLG